MGEQATGPVGLVRSIAYDRAAGTMTVTMWWPQAGSLTLYDGKRPVAVLERAQRYSDWVLPVSSDPRDMRLMFHGSDMREGTYVQVLIHDAGMTVARQVAP